MMTAQPKKRLRRDIRALGVAAFFAAAALAACTPQGDPAIGKEGFSDAFEREELGPLWHRTGGNYQLQDGQLHVKGARNHPLWLRRRLPQDAVITFDARSESPEGDIKVELYGDGKSHATSESYTATSYVVILGGWGNAVNAIARMNEHGSDRVEGERHRIEPGKVHKVRIERKDERVTVWLDGEKLMQMRDPQPLVGRGHDHFGFNNWESDLWFDNLKIRPL